MKMLNLKQILIKWTISVSFTILGNTSNVCPKTGTDIDTLLRADLFILLNMKLIGGLALS